VIGAGMEIEHVDSLDMFGAAFGLPDQLEAAAATAHAVDGLPDGRGVTSVLICGMGGSGIGGDVAAAVAAPVARVPVVVSKHYECPAFVGPDTLVIAISFSGNTEETLAATTAAAAAGARTVVVASGGALAERAADWSAAVVPLDASIPMPRAGIGAVSAAPMVVLERLGLAAGLSSQIEAAVEQLRHRVTALRAPGNPAEALARRIGRTLPLVYGGGGLGEVAAWRWKGQFNENCKVASWSNRIPELTHNEICGWGQHGDVTRQVLSLLLLRHDYEHPQVRRRFDLVEEISSEVVEAIHTVEAQGDGPFAQLMDLVLQGDAVTLHAAALAGVDPGPIPILDDIKARLRG
jgi:glucose/mannose-6-phosphate isomerase